MSVSNCDLLSQPPVTQFTVGACYTSAVARLKCSGSIVVHEPTDLSDIGSGDGDLWTCFMVTSHSSFVWSDLIAKAAWFMCQYSPEDYCAVVSSPVSASNNIGVYHTLIEMRSLCTIETMQSYQPDSWIVPFRSWASGMTRLSARYFGFLYSAVGVSCLNEYVSECNSISTVLDLSGK